MRKLPLLVLLVHACNLKARQPDEGMHSLAAVHADSQPALTHADGLQFLARNGFYMLIDDHSEDKTFMSQSQWVSYYTQVSLHASDRLATGGISCSQPHTPCSIVLDTWWHLLDLTCLCWQVCPCRGCHHYQHHHGTECAVVQLMTDITSDAPSAQRVLVDILNEPDQYGLTWTNVCPPSPPVCQHVQHSHAAQQLHITAGQTSMLAQSWRTLADGWCQCYSASIALCYHVHTAGVLAAEHAVHGCHDRHPQGQRQHPISH